MLFNVIEARIPDLILVPNFEMVQKSFLSGKARILKKVLDM